MKIPTKTLTLQSGCSPETPGEAALGDEAAAEAHFLIRDEDGDE